MVRIMWRGEFDQILLNPFHAGGYLLASGFNFSSLGSVAAGVVVIILAFPATGAVVTVWGLGAFTGLLAVGVLFYMALLLFFCSLTLVVVYAGRFIDLMERLMDFSAFPSDIYPLTARMVYDVAFPFAVFICFPAQALLGRINLVMAGGGGGGGGFFLARA